MSNSSLLGTCLALAVVASARGQFIYNFARDPDQAVLATLEFSEMPANHSDVVSLTFSPLGEEVLGFGPVYQGIFDRSDGLFVEDAIGGLAGEESDEGAPIAVLRDDDPPQSSNPLLQPTVGFEMSASNDLLRVRNATNIVLITGRWQRPVSEPDSQLPCILGLLLGGFMMRRRRKS